MTNNEITINCPTCGEEKQYKIIAQNTNILCKCPECDLRHMVTNKKRDFETEHMYGDHAYEPKKAQLADNSVKNYLRNIKDLNPDNPQKTLVDLGGGLGYYSRAFAGNGVDVTYVEKDDYSLNFMKKVNKYDNLHIEESLIEPFLESTDKKFDIIFFRHVIEHTLEPQGIISLLSNIMHENTVLILETDNNRSKELVLHPQSSNYWLEMYKEEFNLDKKEIFEIMPFPLGEKETHYWGFNLDNLGKLAENKGLKVLEKKEYSLGDQYLWPNIDRIPKLLIRCLFYKDFYKKYLNLINFIPYKLSKDYHGAGILFYIGLNK